MSERLIGPEVDTTPRMLPVRAPVKGQYCVLEPLHRRHAPELWQAAQAGTPAGDASWDYLGHGPFPSEAAMTKHVENFAVQADHVAWAVRPLATGRVSGWLTLMDIQPHNAAVEIGNIWLSPSMQRTRAATESMFLPIKLAMDDLGYRRMVWKCNALNEPSRRAAARLGFTYEGLFRAHLVVKGRRRDTAWFSILDEEWPVRRDALQAWMDPSNFSPDGTAIRSVAEIRGF